MCLTFPTHLEILHGIMLWLWICCLNAFAYKAATNVTMPICTSTLKMPMHMSTGAWTMRNIYRWSVAHAFILHNIMLTVTLNYASISAVYNVCVLCHENIFYMYATIAVAAFCIYRHALLYTMYIEACISIPVPEIYGYNVNMSLHGCLCTIYIHTYTQVPLPMQNDHCWTTCYLRGSQQLYASLNALLEIYQYSNHTKCIRWSVPVRIIYLTFTKPHRMGTHICTVRGT